MTQWNESVLRCCHLRAALKRWDFVLWDTGPIDRFFPLFGGGGGPASTKQSRPPLVTHRRHENHSNKNLTTSLLNWIELYKNFKKFAALSLPLVMQMRHRLFICLHWQTGGRWKWFDFSGSRFGFPVILWLISINSKYNSFNEGVLNPFA